MKKIFETLRQNIGTEDIFYFGGIVLLYIGSAAQFGHAIAQIAIGVVLIGTALYITGKG